jgi:DHA2 family multidrug resistance protein
MSAVSTVGGGGLDQSMDDTVGATAWLITIAVSIATFMQNLDITVVNVALPYIAGGLAVSTDEASWVVTTYLVAYAVIVTASSFLAQKFGRKRVFIACGALFIVSSLLCGFAPNLQSLLLARVLQGIGGGGMVPIAQSIVATSFPPSKRAPAFALLSVSNAVAPMLGPTFGGWLSDNYGWPTCFLVNGPVGTAFLVFCYLIIPESNETTEATAKRAPFDFPGFLLVATFLGTLEVVLDRGLEYDWFGSTFIITFSVVCGVAFVLMVPWAMTRSNAVVDLRLLMTRQFGIAFVIMMIQGATSICLTQFLTLLLQRVFGYTGTLAGLVLLPGGLISLAMLILVGRLSSRVQPKYLIAAGAVMVSFNMYRLTTSLYDGLDFWFFAFLNIYARFGIPLIFPMVTAISYDGIPRGKADQAAALLTVGRNVGSAIEISIANNILADRGQFHQARLVELTGVSSISYQTSVERIAGYFQANGSANARAHEQALAWIGQQVQTQASLLAYIDVFWTVTLISAATVPLAFCLRNVKLGAGSRRR